MPEPGESEVLICGYSERGMVNALCDDILHSAPPGAALASLLSWCKFPFQPNESPNFSAIAKATLLVEQGFSDYGDLDLLILLDHRDGRKQSVMLEAKVRTDSSSPKRIRDQWQAFFDFLEGNEKLRSTLFVQLYRKMRLIHQVENLAAHLQGDAVAERWSLGSNRVVRKAAALLAEYRANPWYVALVPDSQDTVAAFYENTLRPFVPQADLPEWTEDNIKRWGYLTWPDLDARCGADHATWRQTVANFAWNKYQVYEQAQDATTTTEGTVEVGRVYRHMGNLVYAVDARAGQANCRIVAAAPGHFFPLSFKAVKSLLQPTQETPPVLLVDLRPRKGCDYLWSPPTDEKYQPPGRTEVPQPPKRVRFLAHGWHISKVRSIDEGGREIGNSFHVFTHHILRV